MIINTDEFSGEWIKEENVKKLTQRSTVWKTTLNTW